MNLVNSLALRFWAYYNRVTCKTYIWGPLHLFIKAKKNYLLPAWKNLKKKHVVYVHNYTILDDYLAG